MARKAKELSALEVGRLSSDGTYSVGGVAGLQLQIIGGSKVWILRTMMGPKRRRMGLGPYPQVTLADARAKARKALETLESGVDPIEQRRRARAILAAEHAKAQSFDECVVQFLEGRSDEWRNAKHRQQWTNTLTTYASPVIGRLQVSDIQLPHILNVLTPIWKTKTETASRVRGRIENVLDWATVRGYRQGENPARWKGHLEHQLSKPSRIAKVAHHEAMAVDRMPAFWARLLVKPGIGALALRLAILTASRSGEVRGATWSEFDIEAELWTVPAERMKAGKEHRVPLCKQALETVKAAPRIAGTEIVFPGVKGQALSDMTLLKVMRDMGETAVPHGFRSTFRDWASERTNFPNHLAEMALAHTIESKVEAAYRRGDLLGKRMEMMQAWADYLTTLNKG